MKKLLKRFIILFIIIEGVYFFTANYSNAINEEDLPEFYGTTSITIKKGDTLDLKKSYYRIFAKDKIDGNITKNIQVVKNNVNTNVSGNYTIEYKVSNSRGKTTNLSVPVHVISNGERKIERTLYAKETYQLNHIHGNFIYSQYIHNPHRVNCNFEIEIGM